MTISQRYSRTTYDIYGDSSLAEIREKLNSKPMSAMFVQDLMHRHYQYMWKLEVSGQERGAATAYLAAFLSDISYRQIGDAGMMFWELFDRILSEYVESGSCYGEVYLADLDDEGDLDFQTTKCRFDIVPGWSVRRRPIGLVQLDGSARGGWRHLERAQLVQVSAPRHLVSTVNSSLRDLDAIHPEGLVGGFEKFLGLPAYDMKLHQRRLNEMSARATTPVGWSGRGLFMDRATNSYRVYRELRFTKIWLQFVRVAVEGLNAALARAETDSGGFSVRIDGLPSISDVETAMASVEHGSESLDSINRRIVRPRYS
ncbi:hypothetical protein BJY20_001273 [Janibacter cremeus]|uniref:Uncharacterized protein n=1 Tax=Janibacter cremeus TaxID=1285192 RepID=A0A852VWI0_9MICO|nr:hypothetical protein [Janibacter cremeus]